MATTQEEVKIKLGVDAASLNGGLNGVLNRVNAFTKQVTNGFRGIKQMVGGLFAGFTLERAIAGVQGVVAEFKELKKTPEELQKVFGNLTSAETEALENLDKNLGGAKSKFVATLLGMQQSMYNVFANILVNKKTLGEAWREQVDEDIAKIKEFQEAVENSKSAKLNATIQQFNSARDAFEFRRMKPEQQIDFLDGKIKEANALAARAGAQGNTDEQYRQSERVLGFEDQRRTLIGKLPPMEDGFPTSPAGAPVSPGLGGNWKDQLARRDMMFRPLGTGTPPLGGPQFQKAVADAVATAMQQQAIPVRITAVEVE